MNVVVRPPKAISYSVDGLLSLLEPVESAALRLGDRTLAGRLRNVFRPVYSSDYRGEARLEIIRGDEIVPLLDVEVALSPADYDALTHDEAPPGVVAVLHVRRLPGLEELLP